MGIPRGLKVIEIHVFDKKELEDFLQGNQVEFRMELECEVPSKKAGERKMLDFLNVFGMKKSQMAVLEIFEPRAVQNFRIWKRYALLSDDSGIEFHRFEDESDVCPPYFFDVD